MNQPTGLLLASLVAALSCGLLLVWLPDLLRRLRLVDMPGPRSSHSVPTPRGGGVAVLLGLAAGVAVGLGAGVVDGGPGAVALLLCVLGAGVGAGAVGLVEDGRGLPAGVRALLQLGVGALAGVAVSIATGVSWVWVPLAALCLAAFVNVTNFMDGLNTVTGWFGVVVGLGQAAAGALQESSLVTPAQDGRYSQDVGLGWLVLSGCLLAAVSAAFLLFNGIDGRRARLFLGDVGSYGIGAVVAVTTGAGFLMGLPALVVLAPLAVWFADTGHTLVLRAAARQRLSEAHRSHAYQRLNYSGVRHVHVGLLAAAATAVCTGAGLASLVAPQLSVPALLLVLLVCWVWVKLPAWRGHPSPWGAVARGRMVR